MILMPAAAESKNACSAIQADQGSRIEVERTLAEFGSRVVAIGRVDSVTSTHGIEILGLFAHPVDAESFQVGDYGAIIDWSREGAAEHVFEVRPIQYSYVAGASGVVLQTSVQAVDPSRGRFRVGSVEIDYSASNVGLAGSGSIEETFLLIRGTQPGPRGVVLGVCIVPAEAGSLGTGSLEGSLGTGKPDGSLGTGKTKSGSLGTGRPDGSLGTGRSDGSLGTGRN